MEIHASSGHELPIVVQQHVAVRLVRGCRLVQGGGWWSETAQQTSQRRQPQGRKYLGAYCCS